MPHPSKGLSVFLGLALGSLTAALAAQEPVREKGKGKDIVGLPAGFVRFARVPDGGIQPRILAAPDGKLHLVYFRPVAPGGDLFACAAGAEVESFSTPVRVNAAEGSVVPASGGPRADAALAGDGRLHVVWTSSIAADESGAGPRRLFHARAREDGTFEPERELLASNHDVAFVAALAVDPALYVFFSASETTAEGARRPRVWMLRSQDGGATFSAPPAIDRAEDGVSLESALACGVSPGGVIYVLYRLDRAADAGEGQGGRPRDMRALSSDDGGESFRSSFVSNLKSARDPASGASLYAGPNSMLAAWEAQGQVFWSHFEDDNRKVSLPVQVKRKMDDVWRTRPVVAANSGREILLAWFEVPRAGPGQRPEPDAAPVLAWQVWDKKRNMPLENGLAPEPPGSSPPAVVVRADRGFTIVY